MRHFIICLSWSATISLLYAFPQVPDRDKIRRSHENSKGSIRTIHAVYEIETTVLLTADNRPPEKMRLEWWQDGPSVRFQKTKSSAGGANEFTDISTRNGEVTRVASQAKLQGEPKTVGMLGVEKPMERDLYGLWSQSCFDVLNSPRITLDDLLKTPSLVTELTYADGNNEGKLRLLATLQYRGHTDQAEILIDPGKNYLISGIDYKGLPPGSGARMSKKVLSYHEIEPGLYFPKEVETKVILLGKNRAETHYSTSLTRFLVVDVNQPIDSTVFDLAIPPDTATVDYRKGATYLMGENGKPKGQLRPLPAVDSKFQPLPREPLQPQNTFSVPILLILASLALGLILAGIILRYRRAHSR